MSVTSTTEKQKTIVDPTITLPPPAASAKQEEKKPAIDLSFTPQSPTANLRAFYDAALNPTLPATSITAHNACVKDYAVAGHIAGHVAGHALGHEIHAGLPGSLAIGITMGDVGGAIGHKVGEKVCAAVITPDFLPNVPKTTVADKSQTTTPSSPAATKAPPATSTSSTVVTSTPSSAPEPLFTSADPSKDVCK